MILIAGKNKSRTYGEGLKYQFPIFGIERIQEKAERYIFRMRKRDTYIH